MMKRAWLSCVALLPALAVAQPGDEWYLNPQVGAIWPDYRRELRDRDWDFGIGFGRELGQYLNLEMNFNDARINDGHGLAHMDTRDVTLDALGVLNRGGAIAPYLDLGVGGLRNNFFPGNNQTHFMAQTGVGFFINLWRSADDTSAFSLRPDIKARFDEPGRDNHLVDYIATMGFQFAFGGSPKAAPPPPPPPPAPPPVAAAAPAPAAVPAEPPDSDHDGVPDSIDQCPNTPLGVQVDSVGCPLKGSITLEGVTFETNSAALTVASHPPLDAIADGLKKHPRLKVEIQGHTDSTGSPPYNLKLSQRRADSVRSYLVNSGANPEQLETKGYGQSQPVASNATPQGRARNRRVVMHVLSNPGDVKVEGEGSTQ